MAYNAQPGEQQKQTASQQLSFLPTAPTASAELAQITVTSRIPEFWTEMPRLWFAQFDSIMAPQKQSDEIKFNVIVSKLNREAIQQISDILLQPPADKKYQAVKDRLLQVYEESAERQFQKLVGEMDLGTQKPSQLLRKMRELGRNTQVSEQTLKNLWLSRMPAAVRAVIAVSSDQDLSRLAQIADKIVENVSHGEIAEVSTNMQPNAVVADLVTMVHKLSLEIASLRTQVDRNNQGYRRRGSSQNRGRNRSRSQSRARNPGDPNWLCRFHYRFRHRSNRCEQPCAWKTKEGTSTQQGN